MTLPKVSSSQPSETTLYQNHINHLKTLWSLALADNKFDGAVIAAGSCHQQFLDDAAMVFRPNPHFAWWLPDDNVQFSFLVIMATGDCHLHFFQAADFWHAPPDAPTWVEPNIKLSVYKDVDEIKRRVNQQLQRSKRIALIAEYEDPELQYHEYNPTQLLANLHYDRAFKTPFEAHCLKVATKRAVLGHLAAKKAFSSGCSEFEINHDYLFASQQNAEDLPYHNIVALNEHAGVLHYQHYDRQAPGHAYSFLIDAGARYRNYGSDITRTYAAEPGPFADLIQALDGAQQKLVSELKPGRSYADYHLQMAIVIAEILVDSGMVTCSPESAFESGITDTFFPHGLGHLLGLQTHDIGGLQSSRQGGVSLPLERFAALRMTRNIEVDFVFTVEPGLYFIPMLLDELKQSRNSRDINWRLVDTLLPFGGIRIEDNVMVTDQGISNFTRDAFAHHE